MTWFDRATGERITEAEDIRQSINDILTTPLGSRISRRTYGSRLYDMIDQPANRANRVLLYSAVATALLRWEPRIELKRVDIAPQDAAQGRWTITLTITRTGDAARRERELTITTRRPA